MSEPRPQGRLLFVALLLVAQTLLAWHAPAHIFDGHDGHSAIVAHDCERKYLEKKGT